ncbi:DNA-packaging protein [Paenibacillus vini]|uniref:DNA-packaging protein n=1 Tax=Paenibacillus vini TaxID=1476024 RepID=UPI0025B7325E|nr:DNA-packaging protein [Paenibacillus vini]MDN4069259.1 DNA-packaging protein [Paenibacillus vini]MDN4069312.1 DNA-packaging protein [Paenibacillus vini]
MFQENVAKIIKRRWNLPENLDELVRSYIDEAGYHIMNYIGRDSIEEIPAALQFTWANIAMAAFKTEQSHLQEMDMILSSDVDLKIGDTSVKSSSGGVVGAAVMAYSSALNRYRKLRW